VTDLLLIEPQVTRQVFLGEPVEEVLAMVKWALNMNGFSVPILFFSRKRALYPS
jgi:hypothetical protein